MTATYDKLGIHFEYPENWQLDEEEARSTGNTVTVYTPTGGFWSISIQPGEADPQKLVDDALETMRAEYADMDVEPLTEVIEGWPAVGYDMNFYCLDLTNTAQVRSMQTPYGTFVIMAQAEDRDFQQLAPVFNAMTVSLLRKSL